MPVANQYGIDLGNVLSTVSDLKTAQQNRDTNALKTDILSRQNDKEVASDQADQDFLKDPKTATATTVAQKLGWDKLTEEQRQQSLTNIKQKINQHGVALNSIIGIQDPVKQKDAITKYVSTLSPDEQKDVATKYGTSTDELQANLPHMMNDLLISDGGVSLLQKQAEAKTANDNKMDQLNVVWGNKNAIADKGNETKVKVAGLNNDTKVQVAGLNIAGKKVVASFAANNKQGANWKPTESDKNVKALMSTDPNMTVDQARLILLQSARTTNINDPVMGNKTVTSKKDIPSSKPSQTNSKFKEGTLLKDKQGTTFKVINGIPTRIK